MSLGVSAVRGEEGGAKGAGGGCRGGVEGEGRGGGRSATSCTVIDGETGTRLLAFSRHSVVSS